MTRKRKRRTHYGSRTGRRRFHWWPVIGLSAPILISVIVLAGSYLWLRGSLPVLDDKVRPSFMVV